MTKNFFIKLICVFVVIATLINCQKKTTEKYYRDTGELLSEIEYNKEGQKDGELREYYKTGELKTIEYYKNDQLIDTTIGFDKNGKIIVKRYEKDGSSIFERYYENGQLLSKGKIRDTITEGWWHYYYDDGNLYRKIEYVNASNDSSINKMQYPNQIVSFDKKGNIIKDSSNYYTIDLKDTIPLGKLTLGYIDLEPQISKEYDFHMVYFWSEDTNANKTKIDSTYGKNNKPAKFWLIPKNKGKHKLNGYIIEKGKIIKLNQKDTTMVDIIEKTKKLFFEKDFFVKDTTRR
ncbi:toxin-antitoxin system YwqK family antitoxin [Aequorivita sinensis]|uniref:toxin-antitoxin system YwqK family antitoxin n=1 Tax=Aequorivita sinensis TaxID=1382458 RepID=UPI0011217A23|nr:hypothetical protein [Aequorivita sinensis]